MTQGEMLILLYDELLKRLKRGKLLLEKKDYANFEKDFTRAGDIIRYLRKILDMKYPISRELVRLYTFYEQHISRIIAGRNSQYIDDLIPMIQDLRDAFKEADMLAKKENGGSSEANEPRRIKGEGGTLAVL